jgi:hypothetical protein
MYNLAVVKVIPCQDICQILIRCVMGASLNLTTPIYLYTIYIVLCGLGSGHFSSSAL